MSFSNLWFILDTNQLTPGDQLTQTSDVLTQSASRCQQIIPNQLNTDYNAPSQSAGANVLFSNDTGGSSQANNSFEGRRLNRNKNELERQIKVKYTNFVKININLQIFCVHLIDTYYLQVLFYTYYVFIIEII